MVVGENASVGLGTQNGRQQRIESNDAVMRFRDRYREL